MAIREVIKDGTVTFIVEVSKRVSRPRHAKVQKRISGIQSRREAEKIHKRLLEEATQEAYQKAHKGILYGELIDNWELSMRKHYGIGKVIQTTTIQDYIGTLRRYTHQWYNRPASEIYKADILEVMGAMRLEGKSKSRLKCLKNAVNGMYGWASDEKLIPPQTFSPAYAIKLGEQKEEKPPEILNINEIKKLIEIAMEVNHPWKYVWAFAVLTGMRSGELFALEWANVDWENRKVIVSKSHSARMKIVKSTKAGYWRDVPFNSDLELLLQELRAIRGSEVHVLPRLPRWHNGEAARILRTFCVGYGLPSIKFHTLRSCFATQLLRNRVAAAQVMKVAGWRDLKTMQRYIRLAGIEIDGATDSLKILPEKDVTAQVVPLFTGSCGESVRACPTDGVSD